MINGTKLTRKDNPRSGIINAPETNKVPGIIIGSVFAGGNSVAGAWGIAVAWVIGLPRRLGRRLYAMNDAEAHWRGWQITERAGGLVRQYRDPRFDLLAVAAEDLSDPEGTP